MFDCVNFKKLLPIDEYVPGAVLPSHLSPFVEEQEGDYIPPERRQILENEKELIRRDAVIDDEGEGVTNLFYLHGEIFCGPYMSVI